jgi:hypothetical protein
MRKGMERYRGMMLKEIKQFTRALRRQEDTERKRFIREGKKRRV